MPRGWSPAPGRPAADDPRGVTDRPRGGTGPDVRRTLAGGGRTPASVRSAARAFTLVELLIAISILAVLAALAVPQFRATVDKARVARAIGDLRALEADILAYAADNGGDLPESLADVGRGGTEDPWGNEYRYLDLEGVPPGKARKDRFLVPLNSDFDLYSVGADGKTQLALTAKAAQDDVLRANDGGYLGLGSNY